MRDWCTGTMRRPPRRFGIGCGSGSDGKSRSSESCSGWGGVVFCMVVFSEDWPPSFLGLGFGAVSVWGLFEALEAVLGRDAWKEK